MISISKYGFIAEQLRILRNKLFRLKMISSQVKLARKKSYQKKIYRKVSQDFEKKYNKLKAYDIKKFMTPLWEKYNTRLEKAILPFPPFSFLQDPTIMITMFVTAGGKWLSKEISYLEKRLSRKELSYLLEEEYVGDPLLLNSNYLTSHTSIHHLYHLIKYLQFSKADFNKINTVVEWGGGYGNLTRILRRFEEKEHTYIMIDTPLFCALQWLYLSSIFGEKEINLIMSPKDKIRKDKINIVSIAFLDNFKIKADLFISTWALSESSKYSQDFVIKSNWFKADHLLLAYQDNPAGLFNPSRIGKLAKDRGAVVENIEFLSGNHYAFL